MITVDIPAYLSASGNVCFYCGEAVQNPCVMWHGLNQRNTNIFLHPQCADRLVFHLASDARKCREVG